MLHVVSPNFWNNCSGESVKFSTSYNGISDTRIWVGANQNLLSSNDLIQLTSWQFCANSCDIIVGSNIVLFFITKTVIIIHEEISGCRLGDSRLGQKLIVIKSNWSTLEEIWCLSWCNAQKWFSSDVWKWIGTRPADYGSEQ